MPAIETSLVIDAPADAVWAVLVDFERYDDWNPVVRAPRGVAEPGAAIDFTLRLGALRAPIDARVVRADGRELRWEGPRRRALAPLARGSHYFRVEPLDGERCRLEHGEEFGGPVFSWPWRLLAPRLEQSYVDLNEAIAREVARRRTGDLNSPSRAARPDSAQPA